MFISWANFEWTLLNKREARVPERFVFAVFFSPWGPPIYIIQNSLKVIYEWNTHQVNFLLINHILRIIICLLLCFRTRDLVWFNHSPQSEGQNSDRRKSLPASVLDNLLACSDSRTLLIWLPSLDKAAHFRRRKTTLNCLCHAESYIYNIYKDSVSFLAM